MIWLISIVQLMLRNRHRGILTWQQQKQKLKTSKAPSRANGIGHDVTSTEVSSAADVQTKLLPSLR